MTAELTTRALAPWFGAGRTIAPLVGQELAGCKWVGVPFAGGMSEIAEISARSIVVNDLHSHIVNLALCVQSDHQELARRLSRLPFHPTVLRACQERCRDWSSAPWCGQPVMPWAVDYFVAVWMGRSHRAGTVEEFNGGLSRRWNANGGDSNTRYRSALRSLVGWNRIMRRCNFDCVDGFDFLDNCQDKPGHGIYVDAPWPADGDKYRHKFTPDDQRRLAEVLARYSQARVVIRFGDHPLIRELYPESRWTWRRMVGRTQTNEDKSEVLILNGASRSNGSLFA